MKRQREDHPDAGLFHDVGEVSIRLAPGLQAPEEEVGAAAAAAAAAADDEEEWEDVA